MELLAVQGLRAKDWQTNMLRLTALFHYLQLPPPGDFAQTDAALPDAKLIEVPPLPRAHSYTPPSPLPALVDCNIPHAHELALALALALGPTSDHPSSSCLLRYTPLT